MIFHPEMLRYLFLLIPIVAIMIIRYLKGRQDLLKLTGSWREQFFYELYAFKSFLISFGFIVFVLFAVLALTGFAGKEIPQSHEPRGNDIVFVVDISNSMKARDVSPTRLDEAKAIIRTVCENIGTAKFGVVAFKGQGIKIVPITEDVESVYLLLNFLKPSLISTPGSNIQSGIETALKAFSKGEEREKYIILLSDGESLSGQIDELGEQIKNTEINIISIGIGTDKGAGIPNSDGSFIMDSSGKIVISRLNEKPLHELSKITGGHYFLFSEPLLLAEVLNTITGKDDENQKKYKTIVNEKYRIFLIFSLIGLFISVLAKRLKWKNFY